MDIEAKETKEFRFLKWVIFSVTKRTSGKVIENAPVFVLDKEYFQREFKN